MTDKINFSQYNEKHNKNEQKEISEYANNVDIHNIDNSFITKFIKQFFNWIDLNNIKFKKHTNVVNFVNFVLNMYYVLSNSPSPICENLSKTLEWLINRIEELNISNYTKDDLVDFNINIDMDSNKDWYIDFL